MAFVTVDFQYGEQEAHLVLRDGETLPVRWRNDPAQEGRYTYRTSASLRDGAVIDWPAQASMDRMLTITAAPL